MNVNVFFEKACKLFEEIQDAIVADGKDPNYFEITSEVYERLFDEPVPKFEYNLPDDAKAEVLWESFSRQKRISDCTPIEFLQLQYEA